MVWGKFLARVAPSRQSSGGGGAGWFTSTSEHPAKNSRGSEHFIAVKTTVYSSPDIITRSGIITGLASEINVKILAIKMATEATARKFFTAPSFAVVGASSNPAKFGHKVHAWYLDRDLKVTPVNPASPTVTVNGSEHATVPNVSALPNPKETGVSIITHPGITIGVLKEAKAAGIPSIWLQPGTWDDEVLKFALAEGTFEAVVYGEGGRGHDGWCVLVDGDKALKAAGKL